MNVIQFMHPGSEIKVVCNPVGWNTGRHCRRLLCHGGEYVDANNCTYHDNLCFWNEYEAPTNAHPTQHHPGWEYARYYHRIVKPIPPLPNRQCNRHDNTLDECCSNTDPCVFGDTFKYSNCQQVPEGSLWNLPQGSLILFGSLHDGHFYLDTVFVTRESGTRYSVPIANRQLPFAVSDYYRTVTLNNLTPKPNGRSRSNAIIREFMFYRGKLPVTNANGCVDGSDIFSFTPVKILNSRDYNMRCKLDLAALNARLQQMQGWRQFSPCLSQGHKTVVLNATNCDVTTVWREVRDAVINASFYLGYHFAW